MKPGIKKPYKTTFNRDLIYYYIYFLRRMNVHENDTIMTNEK